MIPHPGGDAVGDKPAEPGHHTALVHADDVDAGGRVERGHGHESGDGDPQGPAVARPPVWDRPHPVPPSSATASILYSFFSRSLRSWESDERTSVVFSSMNAL